MKYEKNILNEITLSSNLVAVRKWALKAYLSEQICSIILQSDGIYTETIQSKI
jgi:hypothetical protein